MAIQEKRTVKSYPETEKGCYQVEQEELQLVVQFVVQPSKSGIELQGTHLVDSHV